MDRGGCEEEGRGKLLTPEVMLQKYVSFKIKGPDDT
jgi:hypothetical protein